MFIDDDVRLLHMRDAAREAVSFAQNQTRRDLDTNRMLTLSLVKCIEIIDEAASRMVKQRQYELPQIPWPQIMGLSNRLTHTYFEINLDELWKTVTESLPPLIAELEQIIPSEELPE